MKISGNSRQFQNGARGLPGKSPVIPGEFQNARQIGLLLRRKQCLINGKSCPKLPSRRVCRKPGLYGRHRPLVRTLDHPDRGRRVALLPLTTAGRVHTVSFHNYWKFVVRYWSITGGLLENYWKFVENYKHWLVNHRTFNKKKGGVTEFYARRSLLFE